MPPPPRNTLPPPPPPRNTLPPPPLRLIPPPPPEPPLMDPPPPRRCATPTPTARLQHKAIRNTSLIWRVPLLGSLLPHGRQIGRASCRGRVKISVVPL